VNFYFALKLLNKDSYIQTSVRKLLKIWQVSQFLTFKTPQMSHPPFFPVSINISNTHAVIQIKRLRVIFHFSLSLHPMASLSSFPVSFTSLSLLFFFQPKPPSTVTQENCLSSIRSPFFYSNFASLVNTTTE
jgi:hypothetical protein